MINRFKGSGIRIAGTPPPGGGNHVIQENFIGIDVTGRVALGNGCDGVFVEDTPGNKIGGNVISGNKLAGVHILGRTGSPRNGAPNNKVQGNFIGTDVTGSGALGNGTTGALAAVVDLVGPATDLTDPVFGELAMCPGGAVNRIITIVSGEAAGESRRIIQHMGNVVRVADFSRLPSPGDRYVLGDGVSFVGARESTIGGNLGGEQNLISGNRGNGVSISGSSATDNRVRSNTVGANRARNAAVPNGADGVAVRDGARDNVVRENNLEGNAWMGVRITAGDLTSVLGNFIGSANLPNRGGMLIEGGARTNLVSLNFVGNNRGNGITIRDQGTEGNLLTANNVLGNEANGVVIRDGARLNIIGGLIRAALNAITGNLASGVVILSNESVGNAILGNSIFDNGAQAGLTFLGIDLGGDGVTPNDPGDGDTGPNNLQNFPELTSATSDGNTTTVRGMLNTRPDDTLPLPPATTFRLEFFSNRQCDSSGFGEGEIPLGSTEVALDSDGNATFEVSFPTSTFGQLITATATSLTPNPTDPTRPLPTNTSEFSQCVAVQLPEPGPPTATFTATPSEVVYGQSVTLRWTTMNATEVSIDPGVGYVALSGEQQFVPAGSGPLSLTAFGLGGRTQLEVFVTVRDP